MRPHSTAMYVSSDTDNRQGALLGDTPLRRGARLTAAYVYVICVEPLLYMLHMCRLGDTPLRRGAR
jgi:hypothetical protein